MEQRIKQLLSRLFFLGYCSFEVKSIIMEAIGHASIETINHAQSIQVIRNLERYEQLGSSFVQAYSK